jgi:hypothetical protein
VPGHESQQALGGQSEATWADVGTDCRAKSLGSTSIEGGSEEI